jgi:hypothetical protein
MLFRTEAAVGLRTLTLFILKRTPQPSLLLSSTPFRASMKDPRTLLSEFLTISALSLNLTFHFTIKVSS